MEHHVLKQPIVLAAPDIAIAFTTFKIDKTDVKKHSGTKSRESFSSTGLVSSAAQVEKVATQLLRLLNQEEGTMAFIPLVYHGDCMLTYWLLLNNLT